MFHMYNNGMTDKFNYGDCGPRKITATANSLFFYGDQFMMPAYTLYQRVKAEAADPLSMLWYKPQLKGSWYSNLPLDRSFDSPDGAWVSLRSSWSSATGLFVAMKAGKSTGHAAHGNLDAGDFVLDALGERWAIELCHQDYLSHGYFAGESQDSDRWLYYRTRTAGQNTILYNNTNQKVTTAPSVSFASSGTTETGPAFLVDDSSTALWITNLTSAYHGPRIRRGLKLLGGRSQVLLQDEIQGAAHTSQWRMHTRADIVTQEGGKRALLTMNGKRMGVILQSPAIAAFHIMDAVRSPIDPQLPPGETDAPNPDVRVLCVDILPGHHTVAIIFVPIWDFEREFDMPPLIQLSGWNLTSHLPT